MRENDIRLTGWKAIALYLGRERTTIIRWARERDLPIHRVAGGKVASVYALPAELDTWLEGDQTIVHQPIAAPRRNHFVAARAALASMSLLLAATTAALFASSGMPGGDAALHPSAAFAAPSPAPIAGPTTMRCSIIGTARP